MKFLSWIKTLLSPEEDSALFAPPEQPNLEDEYFPEPIELVITDVFDLHSVPPKQVRAVVEEYLLLTRQKGFPSVRIIHGKGIGVQRELVRSILARTDFVFDWTDAPPHPAASEPRLFGSNGLIKELTATLLGGFQQRFVTWYPYLSNQSLGSPYRMDQSSPV